MDSGSKDSDGSAWRVRLSQSGVYTGGKIEFCKDGRFFVCSLSDNVAVVDTATGQLAFTLRPEPEIVAENDDELITGGQALEKFSCFALHPDGRQLVSTSENLMIKCWDLGELIDRLLPTDSGLKRTLIGMQALDVEELINGSPKAKFPNVLRAWKGHESPVTSVDFHSSGEFFATGSTDRTVKVWNLAGGYCTHNFRSHTSVICCLKFHPKARKMRLISADLMGSVWSWDLMRQTDASASEQSNDDSRQHIQLKNHVSAVTSVCFGSHDLVFTAGRDKVVNTWFRGNLVKSFPVYEIIEGMQLVSDRSYFDDSEGNSTAKNLKHIHILAIAGDKGEVRILAYGLNTTNNRHTMWMIKKQPKRGTVDHSYTGLTQRVVTTADNGRCIDLVGLRFDGIVQFLDIKSLESKRQIIGFYDEIIDAKYVGETRRIAMATNSEDVFLIDLDTFDSELLVGHSALVMSLHISKDGRYIVTGSKDKTIRIWDVNSKSCIAIGNGHTEAVSAVAMINVGANASVLENLTASRSRLNELSETNAEKRPRTALHNSLRPVVVVSASSDRTLKFWSLKSSTRSDCNPALEELTCVHTEVAHDKTINSIAVPPNASVVATASLDKSIKLWDSSSRELLGTFSGHRRGVWHVQFSPIEKVLASASSDNTIRLWSVADFSCIRLLEGHSASVLCLLYSANGQEIISSSSNGVLKVWSVHSGECVSTLEHHADKVWTLARPNIAANDNTEYAKELLSGGCDSRLTIWRDCSTELADAEMAKQEETILIEQELQSSLRGKKYITAARRALELNYPFKLRAIVEAMIAFPVEGESLEILVKKLKGRPDQIYRLWEFARDWNMNTRHFVLAQTLLKILLKQDQIPLAQREKATAVVDPLSAYSERHFNGLDRLLKDSYLLDHVISCMDNGMNS